MLDGIDNMEVVVRLIVSAVIGGIIGVERESNQRPAGIRTHTLVTVGSCLVMMISIYMAQISERSDPSRIAAQVVSGIGFLGAGTIIIKGLDISGLTTAASIWVCSAIGMSIGAGFYMGAIGSTIVVLITLLFLNKIEYRFFKQRYVELIFYTDDEKESFYNINKILDGFHSQTVEVRIEPEDFRKSSLYIIYYKVYFPEDYKQTELIEKLKDVDTIESATLDGSSIIRKKKE